ncbi:UDP-N-acetylglucosamine 1-carboxyvinyltransferase [Liquorilactobacillus satsumensis]|uniref:UDP-N-acetylglucosamine 1-carboxyvinyltransferase n=1 Tax=Liquorilactobacillus satsumensis DSM 16230 = JCM 12392 TaxID=1423801 RepID=A0A0R1VAQ8_9LACO|nr:UDP-N-acetylglucosamine 1-carboxyvinyltransferase [Liquorilactobacillus satsumensis]KRM00051.1 UDP-N-acetylglucosamine 1-carboxyvinyltransferase [Liquorilactobacillus satsumensis DSM 16230 = JCM 12392]MCC7667010.1 UDP-N-acetylglucosamine 1-carboxyvinyltransferase [Liquorilactobacillus satsumensis]MCP9358149.1 UDP-N-acetylglucosamine 1-carboxyvinyltransferase [Liquorilactobacillus satsumensis]MCP9372160.1 UDP-N-acetylglucosamine 1-carboxyvinyltransferase [Liquorilactobacillus satsumensis]
MKKMIVRGGQKLSGEVTIGGAKNSTVALIPAAILADTPVKFDSVPAILDVRNLMLILNSMNVPSTFNHGELQLDPTHIKNVPLPGGAIKSLRASYYFMGALLGKFGEAVVGFPGGDNIGPRPIDQHIKGFRALGAKVVEKNDAVHITTGAGGLHGARIFFDIVSVGATINVLLAAVKAQGTTVIENAAKEPEIVDLATFLNNMGAQIRGAGTDVIRIKGVPTLKATNTHTIIPDRIEAGTYLAFAAANGEGVLVKNVITEHLEPFIAKLVEMGVYLEVNEDSVYVAGGHELTPVTVKTAPFPGFATDLQQPITPLLMKAKGDSTIIDTLYPERIKHISEMKRMGGLISSKDGVITVQHSTQLKGTTVKASEIRAGVALLGLALMSEGTTTIINAENILRGYERIVEKLRGLSVNIEIAED